MLIVLKGTGTHRPKLIDENNRIGSMIFFPAFAMQSGQRLRYVL